MTWRKFYDQREIFSQIGLYNFNQIRKEAHSSGQVTAVLICTDIPAFCQELVSEISAVSVNFNGICAGLFGIAGSPAKSVFNDSDLISCDLLADDPGVHPGYSRGTEGFVSSRRRCGDPSVAGMDLYADPAVKTMGILCHVPEIFITVRIEKGRGAHPLDLRCGQCVAEDHADTAFCPGQVISPGAFVIIPEVNPHGGHDHAVLQCQVSNRNRLCELH